MKLFKISSILVLLAMMLVMVAPVSAHGGPPPVPPKPHAEIVFNDCKGWLVTVVDAPKGAIFVPAGGHWDDPYETEHAYGKIKVSWYDRGWHSTYVEYKVKESEKCLREYAFIDVKVECGTLIKGSHRVITVTTGHATFYMGEHVIVGSGSFTIDNDEVLPWKGYADKGYKFADGSTKTKGLLPLLEKCWVNGPRKECPECGPHQDEIATDDEGQNLVYVKGALDCFDCFKGSNYGYIVEGAYTYARWIKPFEMRVSVTEQTLKDAGVKYRVVEVNEARKWNEYRIVVDTPFEGIDGTYYQTWLPREVTHNTVIFYDLDGNRLDEFGTSIVDFFVPCSLSYGGWFVQKDGTMLLPKLMNISSPDVAAWLISGDAPYFKTVEEANAWLAPLWDAAVESGTIGPLPAK